MARTLGLVLLLAGCAAHTANAPLGPGNTRYDAALGGPVIEVFGARIPAPQLNLGVRRGILDRMDLGGHAYLLPLLYRVLGGDLEMTSYPVLGDGGGVPTVAFGVGAAAFMSLKKSVKQRGLVVPRASLASSWSLGTSNVYAGSEVALATTGAIYSPFLGTGLGLFEKTRVLVETRWFGSNLRADDVAVTYVPVKKMGALGLLLGVEVSR